MGKLQPNFSWQKYEGKPEDEKEQFQYQLQSQHVQVANSVNSTIDDESYFNRERMTSFTWLDGKPIWRQTITGLIVGTAVTSYPLNTFVHTLVELRGSAQNATPFTAFCLTLPYFNAVGDDISLFINATPTTSRIAINVFNNTWANYIFYVTAFYTKV